MSFKNLIPLLSLFILAGCSVGIRTTIINNYPSLDSLAEIHVLDIKQSVPAHAIKVGTVRVYDKGTTSHCDSVTVFNAAKKEARKAGGNVLKIMDHRRPGMASSCHQIVALILKVDDFHDSVFIQPVDTFPVLKKEPFRHDSRLAINAGWSWQTSQTDPSLNSFERDYENALKSGTHYGAQFDYFYKPQSAVSIQVNNFHSSNSVNATATAPNGTTMSGVLSDNINILYVGPGLTWRIQSRTKMNWFVFGFSLGYMRYEDDGQFITTATAVGSTVGFSYDVSYDIGLSKSTALGLGLGWKIGTLTSVDITQNGTTQTMNLDQNHHIGLGHVDLSLGLRFR